MEAAAETSQQSGKRKNTGFSRQLLAVTVVSLGKLNAGMIIGWMSPMTKILRSSESPVGAMTTAEIGFVASLSSYITFISGLMSSYTADRFGRKTTLILAGVPCLLGGILLSIADTKTVLYIARGLTGFSVMSVPLGPMYCSETVHESIRGTLITFSNLAISFGILISYCAFKFLDYKAVNYLLIIEPAIYLCSLFYLPETPYYLANKSRDEAALKSMTWFRGGDVQSASDELKTLSDIKCDGKTTITLFQSFKTKEARTALFIGIMLFVFQTLSGIHIILNYAETIFTETKSPISPDSSAIFTVLIIITSTVVSLVLVDKIGRKPLLYVSTVFGFISHLSLCILFFLHATGRSFANIGTLAVVCVVCFVFTYGVGMGGIPALVLNEVASVEIKSYVSIIAMLISVVLNIGSLQLFPILTESIGIYVNFIIPTISNLLGTFYIWHYVPETKGKSLTEITGLLKER